MWTDECGAWIWRFYIGVVEFPREDIAGVEASRRTDRGWALKVLCVCVWEKRTF